MNGLGLREGDDYAVLIYRNGTSIAEVTGTIISPVETAASLYTDGDETLLIVNEILKIAVGATSFFEQKPRLQEMLKQRIAELKAESEGEEGEPPYPDDGYVDVSYPF